MFKTLIALAIAGATSVSAVAQPAPAAQPAPQANEAQPAQPQMVKKTVCEESDNPYSRISRVCHTIMVPAKPVASARGNQAPNGESN
jgi:cytochrome c5